MIVRSVGNFLNFRKGYSRSWLQIKATIALGITRLPSRMMPGVLHPNMKRSPKKLYLIIAIILIAIITFIIPYYFAINHWLSLFISINATTLLLFGYDKMQAIGRNGRVPEIIFYLLFLCSGFIGGALGMFIFRHKINKALFWIVALISIILYLQLFAWYFDRTEFLLPIFK